MRRELKVRLKRYIPLYLFILIPVIYFFVYHYYPIVLQFILSFKDYTISGGIWDSKWVGLQNYEVIFGSYQFIRLIKNTIVISVLRLLVGFAPPIILAIMLFDLTSTRFRRISQSIIYIPHFFSWVVIYAIMYAMFAVNGYLNNIIAFFGMSKISFLMDTGWFYPILIGSGVWKEVGWGTIIYLAALSNIDTQLFDAAKVDGAGPIQRIIHITIPGILPIVVFLFTLSIGGILSNAGMEQILLFYTPANYSVSDVIDTWVYRIGLNEFRYSLASAVSQFKSVIGLIMVILCNNLAIKISGRGLW
jgi:putative aldouronate transport system permease protein